jgi:hypothetical protein
MATSSPICLDGLTALPISVTGNWVQRANHTLWEGFLEAESPFVALVLVLQRRLVVLRLLAPHDRGSDVRPAPVMSCGASKRDRQTRRCNIRLYAAMHLLVQVPAQRRDSNGPGCWANQSAG